MAITDLTTLDEMIARQEEYCNRKLLELGRWNYNESKSFENGPLKELKELKRKRAAALRAIKREA